MGQFGSKGGLRRIAPLKTKTFREHLQEAIAPQKAVLIAVPKNPHEGDGRGFWRIGEDVYRASIKIGKDIHGHPMDKRWESSYAHFARFWPAVYAEFYTKTKEWK